MIKFIFISKLFLMRCAESAEKESLTFSEDEKSLKINTEIDKTQISS